MSCKEGLKYNELWIIDAFAGIGMDYAVSYFEEALRITPSYADAHFNLAEVISEMGQSQQAINRKPSIKPHAYDNIARIHAQQQDTPKAINWLKRPFNMVLTNGTTEDKSFENIRETAFNKELIEK